MCGESGRYGTGRDRMRLRELQRICAGPDGPAESRDTEGNSCLRRALSLPGTACRTNRTMDRAFTYSERIRGLFLSCLGSYGYA